jgi:2-polyprenyl-3-methyl-5-hydroxy-6-metoxy-1,4-benzoquinol methylase
LSLIGYPGAMRCNVCGEVTSDPETGEVRSNVRKFASEKFALWRCKKCLSIHARDEVDLAYYYADYPFHKLGNKETDWMLRAMYRNQLSRIIGAGFSKEKSLLDYGCGSGAFLKFLKEEGFADLAGYDEYSEGYADKSVLSRQYDCVMTQDLIEHVPEPLEIVKTLHDLAKPCGIIAIGTPNAEAIDLKNTEPRVHTLHQPYHRHILSKTALQTLGSELGWKLVAFHPTMYANTRLPFANSAFLDHYFRCYDNNCDLVAEPIKASSWKLFSPVTLVHALFGSFYAPESDVTAVFQRP